MTRRAHASECPTTSKKRKAVRNPLRLATALFGILAAAPVRSLPISPPRRLVSLAPNLTEIVFAIGAGDRLVGVCDRSDFPAPALRLPRVGGLSPDLERIVALAPDLVLATEEGNSRAAVEALLRRGIPVFTTRAPDLPGVITSIEQMAVRVGLPQNGNDLAARLRARMQAVERSKPERPARKALLLIWPNPPQAAGRGTFGDDLLRRAGGENIIARPGWPVISPEFLSAAACDAVIFPDEKDTRKEFERAFANGPLSPMPAVRAGRLIAIGADLLTRPGPRAFDALEILSRRLALLNP